MSSVSSATGPSTTLGSLKAGRDDADVGGESLADEATTVIASDTRQVDADTTVTTLVMTSTDSRLPNLSLEDVLERSGVEDGSVVVLASEGSTDTSAPAASSQSSVSAGEGSVEEQVEDAVAALEAADAVVVEVETSNDVQTVTVRAADIDSVYTQASVSTPGQASPAQSNYVLLKNGWAYTDLQSSPLELPVGPIEEAAGNGWALWRSVEEGVHEIQDAVTGVWSLLKGVEVDISPKTTDDVSGVLQTQSADSQIAFTRTSTTTLQLSSQGVFTQTRTTLTSDGELSSGVSFAIQTVSSVGGKSSSLSATARLGGELASTLDNQGQLAEVAGDMFGVYRMLEDGITLEMQFADGSVVRELYLQAKDSPANLSVGGQLYSRQGAADDDLLEKLLRLLAEADARIDRKGEWLKGMADAMRASASSPGSNMPASNPAGDARSAESSRVLLNGHLEQGREEIAKDRVFPNIQPHRDLL